MLVKKVKTERIKCDRYFSLKLVDAIKSKMRVNTGFTFIRWQEKGQLALSNWTIRIRAAP